MEQSVGILLATSIARAPLPFVVPRWLLCGGNSKLGSGRSSYCALTREFPATSPFRVGFGTPWWPFGALRAPRRFWRQIQSSHKGAAARESWPRFHPLTAHDPRSHSCTASQLSPTKEDCAVWPLSAAVSVSEADTARRGIKQPLGVTWFAFRLASCANHL
jgi:hypothetical protein